MTSNTTSFILTEAPSWTSLRRGHTQTMKTDHPITPINKLTSPMRPIGSRDATLRLIIAVSELFRRTKTEMFGGDPPTTQTHRSVQILHSGNALPDRRDIIGANRSRLTCNVRLYKFPSEITLEIKPKTNVDTPACGYHLSWEQRKQTCDRRTTKLKLGYEDQYQSC